MSFLCGQRAAPEQGSQEGYTVSPPRPADSPSREVSCATSQRIDTSQRGKPVEGCGREPFHTFQGSGHEQLQLHEGRKEHKVWAMNI